MFKVSCTELQFPIDTVKTFPAPRRENPHPKGWVFFKDWTGKFKINQKEGSALIVVTSGQTVEQLISLSDGLKNLCIYVYAIFVGGGLLNFKGLFSKKSR